MKRILYAFILLSICCCAPTRIVGEQTKIKTEVKKVTVFVPDTTYWKLPQISNTNVTKDSSSFLENKYAKSYAKIDNKGKLHHSLETKEQDISVKTKTIKEIRDSIVYKDKEIVKEVPAELSSWHLIQIYGFWVLVSLLALFILFKLRKPIAKIILGI